MRRRVQAAQTPAGDAQSMRSRDQAAAQNTGGAEAPSPASGAESKRSPPRCQHLPIPGHGATAPPRCKYVPSPTLPTPPPPAKLQGSAKTCLRAGARGRARRSAGTRPSSLVPSRLARQCAQGLEESPNDTLLTTLQAQRSGPPGADT